MPLLIQGLAPIDVPARRATNDFSLGAAEILPWERNFTASFPGCILLIGMAVRIFSPQVVGGASVGNSDLGDNDCSRGILRRPLASFSVPIGNDWVCGCLHWDYRRSKSAG